VWSRRNRGYLVAFLFVLPALLNFVVFRYLPILWAGRASLYQYSLLGGYRGFIGLDHYVRAVVDDAIFWKSMKATVLYVLGKVPLQVTLALALAVFVQRSGLVMGAVRSAIFAPVVTSMIIVTLIWQMMYHPDQGLLNGVLRSVGLPPQPWHTGAKTALPSIIAMTVWKDVGFSMILLVAGLQGIPEEFYEAALVDGATRWQLFWQITLPLLRRTLLFVVVTQTIFAFQVFVPVYQMTKGGPVDATKVIVFYIYQQGFLFQDMGYASALSMIVLVLILIISVVQMRLLRSEVEY
jgi:multiple sugar transport system permease protein/fructooligosaccharide transport system permease protein